MFYFGKSEIGVNKKMPEAWKRRQALQIVAQLPDKPADALRVLELAKELVEGFLSERPQPRLRAVGASDILALASSSSSLNLPGSPSSLPK